MASTFILKRKTFSDNENKGSGIGKKLAIGAGALAATAGAFYGAKRGVFGAGAQKWAGKTWGQAGKLLGSDKMMQSGAKSYGQGAAKAQQANINAKLQAKGKKAIEFTKEQTAKNAQKHEDRFLFNNLLAN